MRALRLLNSLFVFFVLFVIFAAEVRAIEPPHVADGGAFLDVSGHPLAPQIEFLRERGIVAGYGARIFRPDFIINRAEFLKILMRAVYGEEVFDVQDPFCFTDFTGPVQWFWVYACTAKERGIIHGYPDGSFRGTQRVITVEALKMIVHAWKVSLPVYVRAPDQWYDPYIDVAASRALFEIVPHVPGHELTRSEAAGVIVNFGEPITIIRRPESPVVVEPPPPPPPPLRLIPPPPPPPLPPSVPVVTEPLYHGALRLEQIASGSGTAAGRRENVSFLAFRAVAGRQDVILTGLKFQASTGSLDTARNYRLLFDADGDGRLDGEVGRGKVTADMLIFSGIQVYFPEGTLLRLEVHADLADVRTGTRMLQLTFATNDPRYVEAIDVVDGRDLTGIVTNTGSCAPEYSVCWITVRTAPAHEVTAGSRGNLMVTKHALSIPSHQLLLGTQTVPLLRLQFRAEGEDIAVTEIAVGGAGGSIAFLELSRPDEDRSFAIARNVQCAIIVAGQLCAKSSDSLIIVPADTEIDVLVRGYLRADNDGGTSGEIMALTLTANTTGVVAVKGRGLSSSRDLEQNDGDDSAEGEVFIGRNSAGPNIAIVGPTHDAVGAKIIAIENINPDADEMPVPSGLYPFGRFRFRAAPHQNIWAGLNTVTITDLVFSVNATNVEVNAFALFRADDPSKAVTCTASGNTGGITVTCANVDDTVSAVIEQGGFIDLTLQATVTPGTGGGDKVLQASFNQLSDRGNTGTVEWEDGVFPFQWVDVGVTQARSTLYRTR